MSDESMNETEAAEWILDALREMLEDPESVEALMRELESPLTLPEVVDRLPWSRKHIRETMIPKRQIPMEKVDGRWVISRKEFRKALKRNFKVPKGTRTYHP